MTAPAVTAPGLVAAAVRLPARTAVLVIRAYQLLVSPMLGPVCRYAPSCSSYGAAAITSRGLVVGSLLTCWRLLRCNPWSRGGWDPVPERHTHGTTSGRSRRTDRTRI